MSTINLKTDWHSLLSPTTTVPPDVTFLVEDELEEGGQGGVLSKIGAHRVLLAGVSPVFNGMFYGPMDSFGGCWCCRRNKIKYICLGASSFVSFHSINS